LEQITAAGGEAATVMNSAMWYQTAAQTTMPSAALVTHIRLISAHGKAGLTEESPLPGCGLDGT
jgi:hypothetical protein